MSETEKLSVGALVTLLLLVAPAFVLHVDPRFPGSLAGGLLGVAGAVLMVLLLVYPLVKYVAAVRRSVTPFVSLRGLLTFHIYAGVLGPLFGVLHSGHSYQSSLGIALVVAMLAVVVSGFVGRYYLAHVSADIRDQHARLGTLRAAYDQTAIALAGANGSGGPAALGVALPITSADVSIRMLVYGIADLEYAINTREALKRTLRRWIIVHGAVSVATYLLLGLHIWNGVYYGLRWLP